MAKSKAPEACLIWAEFDIDDTAGEHFRDDEDSERGWFPLVIVDCEAEAHPICDALDEEFKGRGLQAYWNPKSDYKPHHWLRLRAEITKTMRTKPWRRRRWVLWEAAEMAIELRRTQIEGHPKKAASKTRGNTQKRSRTADRDELWLKEFEAGDWETETAFASHKRKARDTMQKALKRAREARELVNGSR